MAEGQSDSEPDVEIEQHNNPLLDDVSENTKTARRKLKGMDVVCLSSSPMAWDAKPDTDEVELLGLVDTEKMWQAVRQGLEGAGAKIHCIHLPLTPTTLTVAVQMQPQVLIISAHAHLADCALVAAKGKNAQHIAYPVTHASLNKILEDGRAKWRGDRQLKLVCLSLVGAQKTAETAELFAKKLKVDVVHSGDDAPQEPTPIFFGEFFKQAGDKEVSLKQAFKSAQKHLVEQGPKLYKQMGQEVFQRAARKFKLLELDDEGPALAFDVRKKFVLKSPEYLAPHSQIREFRREEDGWAADYVFQRRLDVLLAMLPLRNMYRRHTVLCGAEGVGKSTVAERVAYYCLGRHWWFREGVLYIDRARARDLALDAQKAKDGKQESLAEKLNVMRLVADEALKVLDPNRWPVYKDGGYDVVAALKGLFNKPKGDLALIVLDNMDPFDEQDKVEEELASLLEILLSEMRTDVHVLITCREKPGKNVLDLLGNCEVRELNKIRTVALGSTPPATFNQLVRRRPSDPPQKKRNGPWDWKWIQSNTHLMWVVHDLIDGNPGVLEAVRELAVKKEIHKPKALQKLWKDTHGKEALQQDAGGKLKKVVLLTGRGDARADDAARYVGSGGWMTSTDDDDDDRTSRRRRRRRRCRHDERDVRDHRGRRGRRDRARAQGERRLRELREEHRELLAERRRLRSRVGEVKAILRRARGLCL